VSPAWWAAFGPADTSVQCGDGKHRLRWADGMLQAVDHPDAEGELVLGALGGDTSPCLDLVAAWGKHRDDLTVLAIGPRSASDQLTIPASVLDQITAVSGVAGPVHGWAGPVRQPGSSGGGFIIRQRRTATSSSGTIYAFHAGKPGRVASLGRFVRRSGGSLVTGPGPRPPRPARFRRSASWGGFAPVAWHGHPGWRGAEVDEARAELIRLLALGPAFQFRLSAAVAHAWSADGANAGHAERARPALTAALAGRVAPAAADWLDIDPDEVEVTVHGGAGWGGLELTKTGETNRLQARLPVGWLASVWAPGFAVVDGYLIVRVLDAAWPSAHVLAVSSPGREPAELSIRCDKGHWSEASR
jgi:hypothetical protein